MLVCSGTFRVLNFTNIVTNVLVLREIFSTPAFYDIIIIFHARFCSFLRLSRNQAGETKDLSAEPAAVKGLFEVLFKGNSVHVRFIRLFPLNLI